MFVDFSTAAMSNSMTPLRNFAERESATPELMYTAGTPRCVFEADRIRRLPFGGGERDLGGLRGEHRREERGGGQRYDQGE